MSYSVRLAPQAADVFSVLLGRQLGAVRRALGRVDAIVARRGVELRRGRDGELAVLRLGYLRVVCAILDAEEVVLVLAIVRCFELRRAAIGQSGAIRQTLGKRAAMAWRG